jgi:homoserine dehydrogenase
LARTDADDVVSDPRVDVVVEVIGGTALAGPLIEKALRSGKSVVTANKELIARSGPALQDLANRSKAQLYYEAAVAGAIPLVRTLQLSLGAEPIDSVIGIVNGTTNYILTSMTESSAKFSDALHAAQDLGYAEADPSADIEGEDAAAKAAIIARLAFGIELSADDISREGISTLPRIAFEIAAQFGCVIKLLALVDRAQGDGAIVARVHPTLVPRNHVLASVGGAKNAIFIRGAWLGEAMLYGLGAGPKPTASAIIADLVSAANQLPTLQRNLGLSEGLLGDRSARFCIVLKGSDQPGVLATIDGLFARYGIALATITQYEGDDGSRIVLTTRPAREQVLSMVLEALRDMDVIDEIEVVLRFLELRPSRAMPANS